uniref:Uncharacterized protein n=1 Tax=Eutreptiella gymnastica TaxID=73025 RepID=A0A7S1NQH9_9EUGL|mmetsp:Transcript_654/g.1291  ORF Transcript_654/g.1291 Transcript_654/m.1291 type:complete len:103 (+) Transcript_654:654-962(+)
MSLTKKTNPDHQLEPHSIPQPPVHVSNFHFYHAQVAPDIDAYPRDAFFFMLALGSNSAVPGMHAYTSWVLVGVCHHEVQETRGKTVFGLGPFAKGGLCDMVT